VILAQSAGGAIGFQATLDTPPSIISSYYERNNELSVALGSRQYQSLHRRQPYVPKLTDASFETQSLIFSTKFREVDSLIPISVDAEQYLAYRTRTAERDRFLKNLTRSVLSAGKRDQRRGVNIGMALPKRFEKVFGEGGGNLSVSGYRRITFSGRSQWTDAQTEAFKQSKFPSLNMEQTYRFDITGTIGSKISVKVSEDSKSEIPLSNRIQIRYKGDDDDILKTIEAGNTNLRLPNTRFVGYSSSIQGLFGLKAEAQLGRLSVTAIASQEKGSAEKASISASGEENADFIRDKDYQQDQIFDLGPDTAFAPGDSVVTLYIWQFENNENNLEVDQCKLLIDPDNPDYLSSKGDSLRMVKLADSLYTFHNDRERNRHYVIFKTSRTYSNALGIFMRIKKESGDTVDVGDVSTTPLILKTLKASPAKYDPFHPTWGYMWRNVYRIPRGLGPEDLNIVIKKGLTGTESDQDNPSYQLAAGGVQAEYINILGLDQYTTNGESVPDNIVDQVLDVYRSDLGLLIFPHRTPFASDTTYGEGVNKTIELEEKVEKIYDYTSATEKNQASQYYLQLSTKTRSSTISLNRANVIEGSERITLNGTPLKKDVDYTIQYDFGRVTLLNQDALDPNADLDIQFEYAPFIAVQKKTLLGVRAEYEWSRDFKFGTTFLYKSDKAQDRKPRVGQETAKMFVMDFDMTFTIRPSFLTKAVDALPLIKTESQSSINVTAEVAQSHPNPNVDNLAYVDDFESSNEQLSLGSTRGIWYHASRPVQVDDTYNRGRLLWHNPTFGVLTNEVYDRDYAEGQGVLSIFRMIFRPNPFEVDSTGEVIDSLPNSPSWAGMMRYFRQIDDKRAQLLEFRARGKTGKIHFDFGRISEDVNGDGGATTEDPGTNNVITEDQDVGLDLLPDSLEPGYDALDNPDPNGDNYYFLGSGRCPVPSGQCGDISAKQELARNGDRRYDSLYY